ncbi:hypothetical protein GOP47_0027400 [Adiantum capillus-veneris]|nr:hypothetical protein GOP47_0027400 [Adiantum capillus-veneris]
MVITSRLRCYNHALLGCPKSPLFTITRRCKRIGLSQPPSSTGLQPRVLSASLIFSFGIVGPAARLSFEYSEGLNLIRHSKHYLWNVFGPSSNCVEPNPTVHLQSICRPTKSPDIRKRLWKANKPPWPQQLP